MRAVWGIILTILIALASPTAIAQNSLANGATHLSPTGRLIAGPQLTGDEYRALRKKGEFTVLRADVTLEGEEQGALSISIGPDFVVEQLPGKVVLYDYRFRRIVTREGSSENFSNESMFGQWWIRWAFLENNMSVSAMLAAVAKGDAPAIERFWIEQRIGVNHPQETAYRTLPRPVLKETKTGNGVNYHVGDTLIGKLSASNERYPSKDHRQSFLSWLVWSQNLHPQLAIRLTELETAPTALTIVGKPNRPPNAEAKQTILRFQNYGAGVNVLSEFAGRTALAPSWPPKMSESMGALMAAAARGEAPNGPVTGEEYLAQLQELGRKGKALDVALLAMHASFGCDAEGVKPAICDQAMSELSKVIKEESGVAWVAALRKDGEGQHAEAAQDLIKLESKNVERPDILAIMIANSIVEAKKNDQLDDELTRRFERLPATFETVFGHDPYVPSRYRDFYNYLHAATDGIDESYFVYIKAYPVIDFARTIPERVIPPIVSAISDMERRVANDFPAHFPVFEN